MTDHRHIVHFDLEDLPVNVEVMRDSRLEGWPVAIGGTGDRGIIMSCNAKAREFRVSNAMPIKLAKRACPQLVLIRGDYESYNQYSDMVREIIDEKVPRLEKASLERFYADLSGMDKHFGCMKYSGEVRELVISESGLPVSFGLASNKTVSRIATNDARPNGEAEVIYGYERTFLAPRPVTDLPMVSGETARLLWKMGVRNIRDLAAMPLPYMENMFGKEGLHISQQANGIDDSPVIEQMEEKSLTTEETFEQDTIDMELMHACVVRLTEELGFRLRKKGYLTGCITVKLRYANGDTPVRQSTIPHISTDDALLSITNNLFAKLYDRRLLVRLIGVRFTKLITGTYQINLFEDTKEKIRLYQAIDHIKSNLGAGLITRASTLPRI
jgi:DNA polymerase-4